MKYSWNRVLSGAIAAVSVLWILLMGGGFAVVPVIVVDTVALILIWNAEDLGGSTFIGLTTSPTPAWIVSLGGWIILSLPVIFFWPYSFR
jgi:hypothetical protein